MKIVKILLTVCVFILCDYKKRTLLFVASFFPFCIMFFINFSSQLRCSRNCENRKNFAHRVFLYPMRVEKLNALTRRVEFLSLHKVFLLFSCVLRTCKIMKNAQILLVKPYPNLIGDQIAGRSDTLVQNLSYH